LQEQISPEVGRIVLGLFPSGHRASPKFQETAQSANATKGMGVIGPRSQNVNKSALTPKRYAKVKPLGCVSTFPPSESGVAVKMKQKLQGR